MFISCFFRRSLRFIRRFSKLFSAHSVLTVLWTFILVILVGSLIINYSLEQDTGAIKEQIAKAQQMVSVQNKDQPKKDQHSAVGAARKKFEKFDPFAVQEKNLKVMTKEQTPIQTEDNAGGTSKNAKQSKRRYLIHWYNTPPFIKNRPHAMNTNFENCEYRNCDMTFNRTDAERSDAVLFDGRWVFEKVGFKRPFGQVWVFAAHETPLTFEELGGWWKKPQWRSEFNWTMTYDKSNTDIFLPYGELQKRQTPVVRDFKNITMNKRKTALMINSHCNTRGKREDYVKKLSKYIDIDILGGCGSKWNCGRHFVHDDCFKILNNYRFFLAFENALCKNYYSEKVYDNFDYDTILVVRGGKTGDEARSVLPKGAIISTGDFKSVEGLGKYLQKLSWSLNDYAEMLRKKSEYVSLGYKQVYQRAMCDICMRMNDQKMYHKQIPDIQRWAYGQDPCHIANDIV